MRRMVLKYRESEKIIKKVNEKITTHADLFDLEDKVRKQKKFYEDKLG
jgi:restriction endonuclease Mrr